MENVVVFNALQTSLSGGIGRYCYELSKAMYLNKNDIDLKIVIRSQDLDKYNFVDRKDLIVINNINSGKDRNFFEQFNLPKIIFTMFPKAIIHYPDTMAPIMSKNKVIITMHDMAFKTLEDEFSTKTKIWKNFITKKSVKKADKIVAITKFTKSEIEKYYPETIDKISVVYNGFNDFSKEEINIENIKKSILDIKGKYILSVNTITPRKNIGGIINAFNIIKDKTNAKLIIAGKEGWKSKEILSLIDKYDIKDRVLVIGKINDDELKYLYKKASLYIYISFYEGFGLSPLEAMSFGVPTIVSNVTSIPEVVGDRAIKVNPNNIEEIANQIYRVLEDEKYLVEIKKNIYKSYINFSWENCAKETIYLYKSLFNIKI